MEYISQPTVLFDNLLQPILIEDEKIDIFCKDLNKIGNLKSNIDFGEFKVKNNKLLYDDLELREKKFKRQLKHNYKDRISLIVNDVINHYNLNDKLIEYDIEVEIRKNRRTTGWHQDGEDYSIMLLYFPLKDIDTLISSSDFAYFESKSKNEILNKEVVNNIVNNNIGINTINLINNFNDFNKIKDNDYKMHLYLSNHEYIKILKESNKLDLNNIILNNNNHSCKYYCMIWNRVMIHSSPDNQNNRKNIGLLRLSFKNVKKK